jgi:hypothetical protein
MSDGRRRIPVRSYRVVFRLERRLFRIDRWRLPFPYGLELRALVYVAVVMAGVLVAGRLPLLGAVLDLLPAQLHWGLLPLGLVVALLKLRLDGRPPHLALVAIARWRAAPRTVSGLRRCPRAQTTLVPLGELEIRPDWRGARYRPARIRGPASITLRYPASAEQHSRRRQLVITAMDDRRPLVRGKTVAVPADAEVLFR